MHFCDPWLHEAFVWLYEVVRELDVVLPKHSTVQYNIVQYSTLQYSAIQCSNSTVKYSTVHYSTVQCSSPHMGQT